MNCTRMLVAFMGLSVHAVRADDEAPPPPPLNFAPGPQYADSARMFQGIPAIERAANGRLWAAWYGGGVGEDLHNYIMLATSGDDGRTWSPVKLVIDPDVDGPYRAFDPCLWHDPQGRLWLFFAERNSYHNNHTFAMHADDASVESPKWSMPKWIARGIAMNKPTITSGGDWLLPMANWMSEGSSGIVRSTDRGATWKVIGSATIPDPAQRNCDEHMLVERRDGSLLMWVRTKYGIGQSVSTDGGRT